MVANRISCLLIRGDPFDPFQSVAYFVPSNSAEPAVSICFRILKILPNPDDPRPILPTNQRQPAKSANCRIDASTSSQPGARR